MQYTFLTEAFYQHFTYEQYPEIEHKQSRPYIVLIIKIDNQRWGLPMRSSISHSYCYWTNKEDRCGVDYTKAVLLTDDNYIDKTNAPHIRESEFEALRGKEYVLEVGFKRYIGQYKKALADQSKNRNVMLCKFSTLQYFHEAAGIW
jgi:protein AbiQ